MYFSVLNEFDIDVSNLKLLSFNLPFIIIFYWSLKDPDHIGNGLIFISGILNDVTLGYPVGLSSFIYLIIIELTIRFLTDFLQGNIYFKIKYDTHNLFKAEVQFRLLSSFLNQVPSLLEELDQVGISSSSSFVSDIQKFL